jgi:hypothetical protein
MTITCQPMDATSGAPAYSAQNERQNMAPLFGGGGGVALAARSGFRVGTPSTILTATSTTWTLGPCSAVISPAAATAQGSYRWATDANVTGSVTASDATYDRKDIVYIQVNDSSSGDGSGALTANVLYAAGTPSATPVAPDLTGTRVRSFLVGTITVPKTGGGSPTVLLNPAVFVAAGGILPISSQTERDALTAHDGLAVRRLDLPTKPIQVWTADASKWLTTGGPGIAYVPIWTGVTDFGSGGSLTGTYWVDGDRVTVRSRAKFGASATIGTAAISCPLPPGYPVAGTESGTLGTGFHVNSGGVLRPLVVFAGSTTTASVWSSQFPVQTLGTAGCTAAANEYIEIAITYQTSGV